MKKWLLLTVFIIVPLACVIFVNVVGDTANLFHISANKDIALSILAGNATYGEGAIDERGVKRTLIENLPEEVDTLAVGTSVVMCINRDIVGTDSFYNLGESASDYYDILAQFGLLEINKKKYKRIIFCADFDFFNKGQSGGRHYISIPYANYMLSVLNGNKESFSMSGSVKLKNRIKEMYTKMRQLVSIQYFQSSVKVFFHQLAKGKKRYGIITPENADKYFYYESDGSWVYDVKHRSHTEKDVIEDCLNYVYPQNDVDILGRICDVNEHLSDEKKEIFSSLMNYLKSQGIEVLIFLCPFPPALYDLLDQNLRPLLPELELYIRQYAEQNNIRVTGSYNPHNLNITNSDFYDARHVRREKLGEYFDFATRSN